MQRSFRFFSLLFVAFVFSGGAEAQQAPSPAVLVPAGNGAPVITDGIFDAGEWDDAKRIAIGESAALYVKQFRGVVFIGVRGNNTGELGPSELSLAAPNGPITKLHVSAQLYEVALPPDGAEPAPRFGSTSNWYANEIRRDEPLARRLQMEGKSPMEIIRASSYPCDGIEFAIRRAKVPGQTWLIRLWMTGFFGGKPGMLVHPAGADERKTDGWLALRLD